MSTGHDAPATEMGQTDRQTDREMVRFWYQKMTPKVAKGINNKHHKSK